ncbi:hypothetical protein RJ641_006475 [Dillenia turbinata]|uniref:Uncharacterized protein n=1 Tax=Dillenia turbinata TaxID=194707 RepID=A0AAN8Z646_9MAGN
MPMITIHSCVASHLSLLGISLHKPILNPHSSAVEFFNSSATLRRIPSASSPIRNSYVVNPNGKPNAAIRTCKTCKRQFDPLFNHPRACRFHTSHFGGETKSVHTGGTKDTPDSGKVLQCWHCCGSEDPLDPGCTAAPHLSYDE